MHTHRQEALALVRQLTQLQARYRSLQSDTLRRSSLIQSANHSILLNTSASSQAQEMVQLHTAAAQQSTQLQSCLGTLMAIEECLRQVLAQTAAPLTHTGTTTLTAAAAAAGGSVSASGSFNGSSSNSSQLQGMQQNLAAAASHLSQLSLGAAAKNISSHMIQTISTRFDMSSGLVTRAGSSTGLLLGGALKGPMQLEDALEKIQGIIPLLRKAVASATAAAGPIMSVTGAGAAARGIAFPMDDVSNAAAASGRAFAKEGGGLSTILSCGSSSSGGSDSEGGAGDKIPAGRDAGGADSTAADVAAKCRKCDSLKPLLALMQKVSCPKYMLFFVHHNTWYYLHYVKQFV
jgi:hypothetical protein